MRDMREVFDRLFAEGREAVASGRHETQTPPVEGSVRWGCSALLRPDAASAAALDLVARGAAGAVGGTHWITGAADRSHLTVRGLEYWREKIGPDDPLVRRYTAALATAAWEIKPLTFDVTGLTLTSSSVLACALPRGGSADRLAAAFAEALGPDGWREDEFDRDIWYLTLVHFTGAVEDPDRLAGWVGDRRELPVATVHADEVQLAQWLYDGDGMVPHVLASVPLG